MGAEQQRLFCCQTGGVPTRPYFDTQANLSSDTAYRGVSASPMHELEAQSAEIASQQPEKQDSSLNSSISDLGDSIVHGNDSNSVGDVFKTFKLQLSQSSTTNASSKRPPTDAELYFIVERFNARAYMADITEESPECSESMSSSEDQHYSSVFQQVIPDQACTQEDQHIIFAPFDRRTLRARGKRPEDYYLFYKPILDPRRGRPSTPDAKDRQWPLSDEL